MDGYKPGFPLYLLYTRPVPTVVFVGVAMAYDALSCVALYLVSAALAGVRLRPAAAVVLRDPVARGLHLAYTCIQWSTRSRVVQWIGSIVHHFAVVLSAQGSRGVAAAGRVLARRERSDDLDWRRFVRSHGCRRSAAAPRRCRRDRASAEGGIGRIPGLAGHLFRFPCPTSSATRAQVWFELKSSGLPVLAVGLAVAILIFLLFAISIPSRLSAPLPLPRR